MLRKPLYRVEVNGIDYTSRFRPVVKSIRVSDRSGVATDSASILVADRNGSVKLPTEGDRMRILLGDSIDGVGLAFSGFVADVLSRGSKRGGRELDISAKGVDPRSSAREAQGRHLDDTTLGEAAKKFAENAGIDGVVVAPELSLIERPYWSMQFESFMHWGQRISREVGATFKMQDGKAIFLPSNAGKSAGGVALPTVRAAFGENLLNWSITPTSSRERSRKVRARYFDERKSRWIDRDAEIEGGSGPIFTDRFTSSSEKTADARAASLKSRAERNGGEGSVLILGTAFAKPEAPLLLSGTRPGIDGTYVIDGVEHNLTKRGGYVVTCEVKKPSSEVGKDSRTGSATPSSPSTASTSPTSTGRAAGPV
ncbi:phage late control D family protein [Ancylobacter polymorphus]|uniref:Phage protein D n=1 Tax=Ancylobacter polymorphus TaxID=223390 RepID=A0ABU0B9Z8_9HYPH|nr:hypothetical protein [Ancylobacter polymorphus]MDQ0301344.1 phage protein D [Ancylobacter polymorphus]